MCCVINIMGQYVSNQKVSILITTDSLDCIDSKALLVCAWRTATDGEMATVKKAKGLGLRMGADQIYICAHACNMAVA